MKSLRIISVSLFLPLLGFITEHRGLFFRDFAGVIFPVLGLIYITVHRAHVYIYVGSSPYIFMESTTTQYSYKENPRDRGA